MRRSLEQQIARPIAHAHVRALALRGLRGRAARALTGRVRQLAVRVLRDPCVTTDVGGFALALSLSHELPAITAAHPEYGQNLGRLAAAIAGKYPGGVAIDIGANIGDTAALIRSASDMPLLCLEGDPRFGRLLGHNLSGWPDVEIELVLVGDGTAGTGSALVAAQGTAHLAAPPAGAPLPTSRAPERLPRILERHPRIDGRARLLKVDTDGYEARILDGARSWLAAAGPIVFFEYDPSLLRLSGDRPARVLETLRQASYSELLVWDNTGRYVRSVELSSADVLDDLDALCTDSPHRYCDVAAFRESDRDIAERVRLLERARSAAP